MDFLFNEVHLWSYLSGICFSIFSNFLEIFIENSQLENNMQRFFVTFPLSMDLVLRDTEIVHQLTRVLRIKVAEHIVLFDGDGSETEYEITSIEKKSISLRGYARTFPKTEVSKNITLFQGIPNKYEKIEYILQKGVEIGIRKFVFFRSDHSQKLLITTSKKERFYTIAREALEQCGGLVMPEIVWIDDGSLLTLYQKNEREDITLDTIGSKNVRF